jgi:hypothetical protein
MDIGFYILIPPKVYLPFPLMQKSFTWGDQEHPQGSPYYEVSPHIKLVEGQIPQYLYKFLPVIYQELKWYVLDLQGDALDLLEKELCGEKVDWQGAHLDQLLISVTTSASIWVIIFLLHHDTVDEVYSLTENKLIQTIHSNLSPNSCRKGFVAYSERKDSGLGFWIS